MRAENYFGVRGKMFARGAEHVSIFIRGRVTDGVRKVNDVGTCGGRGFDRFEKETEIGAAGVFGGQLHVIAMRAAIGHSLGYLRERLAARNAQFVLQVQVRGSEKN